MRYARLRPSSVLVRVLINALEITVQQSPCALQMFLHGHYQLPQNMAQKRLVFTSKSPTSWHHSVAHALFPTHLHSFDGAIAMEEQRSSLATPTRQTNDRPEFFRTISLKTAPKQPFLDTKSAIEWAKRLKTEGNLFVVRGRPMIFASFRDNRPKNSPEAAIFRH